MSQQFVWDLWFECVYLLEGLLMVDWECCIFCFGFCRSSPLLFRESKGDCTRSCFRTFYCKGGSVSKHADFTLSTPEPSWRFIPTCERRDCGELLWNLFTSKVKSLLLAKTGERHEWMGFVAVGTRICKSNTANIIIMLYSLALHTWHLLKRVSRMTKYTTDANGGLCMKTWCTKMCLLLVTDNAKCPTEDCRIEDRIAKKLVSALNAVLLMDGLNLGADVAKLHSSFRPFMVRTWLTTRDRELKVHIYA